MNSMKVTGLVQVKALLQRVGRLHAMRRIGEDDHDYISKRLKEVEARIVSMRETDEFGKEV